MTTSDPVLAKINESLESLEYLMRSHGQMMDSSIEELRAPFLALRSAVEKHFLQEGDWDENANAREVGYWCNSCSGVFPCPEYKDIANHLGVVL